MTGVRDSVLGVRVQIVDRPGPSVANPESRVSSPENG
jgi:hypothetical protein